MFRKSLLTLAIAASAVISPLSQAESQKDIVLTQMGTHTTGEFDEGAAEIVSYDPATFRLFVINAADATVDILDIADPANPTDFGQIDVAGDFPALAVGGVNSVAVKNGLVAVAVENDNKQANGWVVFYDTAGNPLKSFPAGALPDCVVFTPNGQFALAANEGEPNGDYSVDPEGSITVIDLRNGVLNATATNAGFGAFTDVPENVRAPRPYGASLAQDLEPEYIAVSQDSRTAWVTLQENNAIATVDIKSATVTGIVGLGAKDHSTPGAGLDASDRDAAINIANWPLLGTYMPDTIASFKIGKDEYLVTANEGDAREYITEDVTEEQCDDLGAVEFDDGECIVYLDEIRVKDIPATAAPLPDASDDLFADNNIGRISVIADMGLQDSACLLANGQPGEDCVYESLHSYGARSISIWNASGELVSDTGDTIEQVVAATYADECDDAPDTELATRGEGTCPFNQSNDENGEFDSRSDAKGPEPEGLAVGKVHGDDYAFVGLERVGGIMIFDISEPASPRFVSYTNNRDFSVDDVEAAVETENTALGDLGPEGMLFIKEDESPIGVPLLVVGNEVSGTTTVYRIDAVKSK